MVKFYLVISFLFLFMGCTYQSKIPNALEAGWEGKKVCKVIHEDNDIRVLKCTFPPNVGHEWHRHQPHFGYAISGSTFEIKDAQGIRTVKVTTGASFANQEFTEHEVLNVGDSTAIFLITEYK